MSLFRVVFTSGPVLLGHSVYGILSLWPREKKCGESWVSS